MPTVRPATADELPRVGAVLAAAFADDPVWEWLTASTPRWTERATPWFIAEARTYHRGTCEVLVDDDVRGAALWAPPGHWRPTTVETARLAVPSVRLFGRRTVGALRFLLAMERVHPRDQHWYLAILGTDPSHQGHGIGGALIRAITDRCDDAGIPSYLESSKASNVPFYNRHGFVEHDELTPAPGGPSMWPMRREPRPVEP